jgi:hypothetical protein
VSRIRKKTFYLQFCMGTTSLFNTSKVKKKQRYILYRIYPTKFGSSTQKQKKIIETPNQPIEIKKTQIKVCLVLQKWKEDKNSLNLPIRTKNFPKIRIGASRRNLLAQPKILRKWPEHQIYQSEQTFSQKKVCLVL